MCFRSVRERGRGEVRGAEWSGKGVMVISVLCWWR